MWVITSRTTQHSTYNHNSISCTRQMSPIIPTTNQQWYSTSVVVATHIWCGINGLSNTTTATYGSPPSIPCLLHWHINCNRLDSISTCRYGCRNAFCTILSILDMIFTASSTHSQEVHLRTRISWHTAPDGDIATNYQVAISFRI